MVSRATEPIDGNASPRNPSVRIASRSSSASFEVAWRSTARSRSARVMPAPSSVTRISRRPPPSVNTSMRRAPASSAFSTSSLTTLAGRSTTSPAAMRLTIASESWRTGIFSLSPLPASGEREKRRDSVAGRLALQGGRPRGKGGRNPRYSSDGLPLRRFFMWPRCFLPSIRRLFSARGTLVARRGFGLTAAWRIRSNSRSRASARLRVWSR